MNIKEAKAQLKDGFDQIMACSSCYGIPMTTKGAAYYTANGYLKALKGPEVKALIRALKQALTFSPYEDVVIDKALAKFKTQLREDQ